MPKLQQLQLQHMETQSLPTDSRRLNYKNYNYMETRLKDLDSLVKLLKFNNGKKPKYRWSGNKKQLGVLIKLVFGNSDDEGKTMTWTEYSMHNVISCKFKNLTFKYYTTTTTLWVQGQDETLQLIGTNRNGVHGPD